MRNISYWLRFSIAFISRFKALILAGAGIGIVIFLVITFFGPRFFASNTEKIGITGRFTPDSLPGEILEDVSDGLTKISVDGLVEPSIASHWETPDKGKTWVFYIREDARWQNGQEIKSEDIIYRFSDVEIERPDDATIVFKLKDAFAPFPSVVSRPIFKTGFLGSGEWKVADASLAGTYLQSLTLTKAGENKRIYKFYPTEERTKLAYKLGHVDMVTEIIDPKPLDGWQTTEIEKNTKSSQIVTLFYNNEDGLFKDNKELRQALNYAINKDVFPGERAISPIPPSNWVYNPQVKPYAYNQERAREILESVKLPQDTEIKLATSPVLLPTAESIAKDWEAVGVKTIIQVSSVIPTEFQAYLTILDVPKDPDQYSIWHSTQKDSTNISKFGNVRIDKLLEDGRLELDTEARRQIYIDFQRFMAEELPGAFLYHPVTYTLKRK